MVDESRRRGDRSGGEERTEPERPAGGSEWLLQQLSNGRLKSIFDAPRQAPSSGPSPEEQRAAEQPAAAADEVEPAPAGPASSAATGTTDPEPDQGIDPSTAAREESAPAEEPAPAPTGSEDPAVVDAPVVAVPDRPAAPEPAAAAPADPQPAAPDTSPSPGEPEGGASSSDAAAEPRASADGEPSAPVRAESTEGRSRGPLSLGRVLPQPPAAEPAARQDPPAPAATRPVAPQDTPREAPPVTPPPVAPPAAPPVAPPPVAPPAAPPVVPPRVTSPPVAPPPVAPPAARPPAQSGGEPTDAPRRPRPHRDRPEGATAPTPRDPEPAGAVYHWPDPRGGWDAPPVWEDIVAVPDDIDDDGGDEELWRETAGAYAWNLEPTDPDSVDDSARSDSAPLDAPAARPQEEEAAAPAVAVPFTTAPATAHVNSAATTRAPRGKQRRGAAPAVASVTSVPEQPRNRPTSRRRLLIGLIALGTVIVLAAITAIGVALASGDSGDSTPAGAATATATASPTPEIPTVGPLPPGTWAWSALLGGECLQPFDSVWAEEFTVVDCSTAHAAEMVATAELTDAAFPGQEALAASVAALCRADGVVDMTGAASYGDVQVSGSFPATQEQWDAGERSYYCFVDRAGGGELLGSLVGTPAS